MNSSITITSIEECKEGIIEVDENLERHPEYCIYRVPKILRKMNEEAYTPKIISIGPLHHGKDEFAVMEKQKIRYKREFEKRITIEKWQELINFIEENEQRIRDCYAEMKPKLQKLEFVTMILYDAVFIIELLFRNFDGCDSDFLKHTKAIGLRVRADLRLLENQLPFFVLDGLYQLAFPGRSDSFFLLSTLFFGFYKRNEVPAEVEVKHFTDLERYFMTKNCPKSQSLEYHVYLPCAVKLQESGVKFVRIKGECLLDIRFVKKKLLRFPFLNVDELQIPNIVLQDSSEGLIRNVMALEQYCYPQETLVCNYIDLMDKLIDTEEDVNLLVEAGIISNWMCESARVAKMFNKLCHEICVSRSHCVDIFDGLNAHYGNRWNHTKANLRRVYFNNLWRGTGTVAAVVLLLLTLIQTICSIKSVV